VLSLLGGGSGSAVGGLSLNVDTDAIMKGYVSEGSTERLRSSAVSLSTASFRLEQLYEKSVKSSADELLLLLPDKNGEDEDADELYTICTHRAEISGARKLVWFSSD
jgi:hypothetical protein